VPHGLTSQKTVFFIIFLLTHPEIVLQYVRERSFLEGTFLLRYYQGATFFRDITSAQSREDVCLSF
jgi:hypothetical protein